MYSAEKVDKAVESVILEYLEKIKQTPKSIAVEKLYKSELQLMRKKLNKLKRNNESLKKQLIELSGEIGNSLMGNSKFTPDMLSDAIETTKKNFR